MNAPSVIPASEVRRLLPMEVCIDLMGDALKRLASGGCVQPLRWGVRVPEARGILGMMPGYLDSPRAMGLKVVAVMPGNHGTPFDSHQGYVILFDVDHGFPIAIVDASEITALRTAATSGAATRLLARGDASDLAILGSGTQARTHLEAMLKVRDVRRVRVYSRSAEHRRAFADRESARHGIEIEAVGSARDAVTEADLICTTTSSSEPVLMGDWIAPGAHINAVGSSVASARELDTDAVVRARLYVDRRESTLNESGDFLFPKKEGAVNNDHIVGEIGEVLIGRCEARRSKDEITLFKSLGLAVEDLAAAHHVYQASRAASSALGRTSLDGTR